MLKRNILETENVLIKVVLIELPSVHETLRFLYFISPIVWNMSENLHFFNEAVYLKELHKDQEYY